MGLAGLTGRAAANPAPERMALVIGNANYKVGKLTNPISDARAIANRLGSLGWSVTRREDASLSDLLESLRDFSAQSGPSALRLVFYAGHGLTAKGRNYIVPVEARPQSEDEVASSCVDIAAFVDRLGNLPSGANIVVLDACRANPFKGGVHTLPDGRVVQLRGGLTSGLRRLDAPVGTLVAFSTAPNGIAVDSRESPHSVYAKHLLQHLGTPGLPIEQMFKRVRIGVAQETNRTQVPWESSSLTAEVCLAHDKAGRCGS